MQRDLRVMTPWTAGMEEEIEVGISGGCRLVLRANSQTLETMKRAARISGQPVEVYAVVAAARILDSTRQEQKSG